MYAWSDLYLGGEIKEVKLPAGGTRKVVATRNIVKRGESVSKGKFDSDDWDAFVENGSIRPYPLPEEASEYLSPTQAILARLSKGQGEIDENVLLELALTQPAVNVVDDEPVAEPVAEGA